MKFGIRTSLSCAPSTTIDLPIKSWSDIKQWYVKWDVLHYTLDGDNWVELDLNNDSDSPIDWKRPSAVSIYDPESYETIEETEE
jgi:hypothetical protein